MSVSDSEDEETSPSRALARRRFSNSIQSQISPWVSEQMWLGGGGGGGARMVDPLFIR